MSYDIEIHVKQKRYDTEKKDHCLAMMSWCDENLGKYQADFIDFWIGGYVLFDDEADAMAFKLVWVEE